MKEPLKVINNLKKQRIINDYAIGGGIAAIYYIEPILTYDLDIFVVLPGVRETKVIDMAPLYERLQKNGYSWQKEHLMIEGVPVQFIPADELETEAIQNAIDIDYEGVKTRVFPAEYLIAILTRAGRPKDVEKVKRLLEQTRVNHRKLQSILSRYGLLDNYNKLSLL